MRRLLFCMIAAVVVSAPLPAQPNAAGGSADQVRVWEEPITIPTYRLGEPERNPIFYTPENYQGAQMHIYPYPLLDKLTDEKTDRTYRGLFLENRYVKLCILPELGGRLYYAKDKANGYDFVYYNQVIKPVLIGMAGAWISGGVEWNIPHHHRVSTFMPVDYLLQSNPDGSKTVWVGEYEKRHQTRWVVSLTLYPGRSYVETTIRLFNVTPLVQSFLIWANAAVHGNQDYQVVFPPDVERAAFHSKVQFTDWPVSHQVYMGIDFRNVNVSWWKNTTSPTSFFAWDTNYDFLAGIDHGKAAGTAVVGDHQIFVGKKFWNWGNNEVARQWDKVLTDKDGPYLELMMGAYSDNQPDYSWNDPMAVKRGTMYYFPLERLGSIKNANRDFALNLELENQKALVEVNATGEHQGLELVLSNAGKLIATEKFDISPVAPFSRSFALPEGTKREEIRVHVASEGRELISYQPEPVKNDPAPEVYKNPKEPAQIHDVDELFVTGLRLEQFGNPDYDPWKYYQGALAKDPGNILVNTHFGIGYLRKGVYEEAEKHLRKALSTVTARFTAPKYAEPFYYLGVTLLRQGRLDEAYDILNKASWAMEFASPASYLAARIDCRQGRYDKALENLQKAEDANQNNLEALNLKAIVLGRVGRTEEARAAIEKALTLDPLDFVALNEKARLAAESHDPGAAALRAELVSRLRDEPDNYLETAARYGNAGFYLDGIDLLSLAAGSPSARLKSYPMIHYYLADYYSMIGDDAKAAKSSETARNLPLDYCFPYGYLSAQVLEAAVKRNPADAAAHYYLGNVYCDDQPDRALAQWQAAAKADPSKAVVFRNLAFVQANIKNDMSSAVQNIDRAIALNPSDPRYLLEAERYHEYAGTEPAKRLAALEAHLPAVEESDDLVIRRAALSTFGGNYDQAIQLLSGRHFRTAEGREENTHVNWTDAFLLRGQKSLEAGRLDQALADFQKVLEFPDNLESSRDTKTGAALYFIGRVYQAKGDKEKAKQTFEKLVGDQSMRSWGGGEWKLVEYCKARAYEELGRPDKAKEAYTALLEAGEKQIAGKPHSAYYLTSVKRRRSQRDEVADGHLSRALGYFGLGDRKQAEVELKKTLEIDPANLDARALLTQAAKASD